MACKYICLHSPSLTEDRHTLIYQTGHITYQPQRSGARQLKHRITLTDPQVSYIVFFDGSRNSFPYKAGFFHRLPTTTGCTTALSQEFLTRGRSRPSYRARITQKRDRFVWLQLSTNVQGKTLSWKASKALGSRVAWYKHTCWSVLSLSVFKASFTCKHVNPEVLGEEMTTLIALLSLITLLL